MYRLTIVIRPVMIVPVLSDQQKKLFSGPMATLLWFKFRKKNLLKFNQV
jgi:hypothetical protein